jgi:hypothetical protein
MQRSVKTGKITEESFDPFTRSMLENIWDEAWIHLKQQPKQGDLFEDGRIQKIEAILEKAEAPEILELAIDAVVARRTRSKAKKEPVPA